MDSPGDPLMRVTKPLRCTSLHQSISAESPRATSSSLRTNSPLRSVSPDDENATGSQTSSNDNDTQSDTDLLDDLKYENTNPFDLRRHSFIGERKLRRPSSGNSLKSRYKPISLSYTSPITAATAMNDIHNRRDASFTASELALSPEVERAHFLAELPEAIARARKVHYRRDALLPRTKSFARVQRTLQEDSAPYEADVQKEATLAKILKEKEVDKGELLGCIKPLEVDKHGTLQTEHMNAPTSDRTPISLPTYDDSALEETLFTMEDINTSTPKLLTSPDFLEKDSRGALERSTRSSKRKNEDSRYEPYSTSYTKRRAVSPSPSSPLGSSRARGSIFRIEDLSL